MQADSFPVELLGKPIYVCVSGCIYVHMCIHICNAGDPSSIPGLGRSRKGMFPFTTNALIYKINQDLMFSQNLTDGIKDTTEEI